MPLRACRPGDPVLLDLAARAVAEVPAWGPLVLAARRDPRPFLVYEEDGAALALLWATRGPCQWIGGVHVAPARRDVVDRAVAALVAHLRALPETLAIVAPATTGRLALTAPLTALGFATVERRELVQDLARVDLAAPPLDPAVRLGAWDDAQREPAARLIERANRGRVDGLFLAAPAPASLDACRAVVARVVDGAHGPLLPDASAVAIVDGELAGLVLATLDTPTQALLFELAVAPAHAGRGLARALVRHLQRAALATGLGTMRFAHCAGNPGVTRLFHADEILASTSVPWLVWTAGRAVPGG